MIDLEAPINYVTVYADRALVTRQGKISLEAGEHELRVNTLPQFLRDSLRAAGRGPQGTTILNVDVTNAFFSQPPEATLVKLQGELEQLQQQLQLVKARQDSLNDRRQWLRALGEQSKEFAKGFAQGQMKPTDCTEFFTFMAQQAQQDAETALGIELQSRRLQQEVAAKSREYNQVFGNTSPDRLAAIITVALAEAGELELEISYLIMGASWRPHYDLRVQLDTEKSEGSVEVSYVGIVQQSTGEAWEHVGLSLSTARPSLAAVLPDLDPWYLNPYVEPQPVGVTRAFSHSAPGPMRMPMAPAPYAQASSADMIATGSFSMKQEEAPSSPVFANIATAVVEKTGTALVFRAGRSVDVPSDNTPHKTTIARDDLPCSFDYVSAPVLEEQTHLRATITNTSERVLLSGDASIFVGGEYVGTTKMQMTAPNERFKIFLGIDDNIKVKRELIERSVDKGSLLQGDIRRITYAYQITVHNYASNTRRVAIRDHLPVPQHERIKVKVQNITPQPTERTKLEVMTWEMILPANGEQKITYRFVVEHPQDMKIVGQP
jgi:uncharacterized protein (TIGR02231 family)